MTVESIIDYGTERFARCLDHDSEVFVKIDKDYSAGDKLHVAIDVEKSRIFENLFDIRLY